MIIEQYFNGWGEKKIAPEVRIPSSQPDGFQTHIYNLQVRIEYNVYKQYKLFGKWHDLTGGMKRALKPSTVCSLVVRSRIKCIIIIKLETGPTGPYKFPSSCSYYIHIKPSLFGTKYDPLPILLTNSSAALIR